MAILAAMVISFFLGGLWYGPLFGKAWYKEVKFDEQNKPDKTAFVKAAILNLIGTFLTAYITTHISTVWRPSTWNAGADSPSWQYGFYAAFFVWIGYYLPEFLTRIGFEKQSLRLFAINAGYTFLNLQIVAMIVSAWR